MNDMIYINEIMEMKQKEMYLLLYILIMHCCTNDQLFKLLIVLIQCYKLLSLSSVLTNHSYKWAKECKIYYIFIYLFFIDK